MYFRDRLDAGQHLAEALQEYRGQNVIVLGIPRGGVAVAHAVAQALDAELDVIIPRKLPLPFSPEAGFGAVAEDGSRVLNERLIRLVGLSAEEVAAVAETVLAEIQRRVRVYRGERPSPVLNDRVVILVDDGLATGFTMLAGIQSVRKHSPAKIVVAVPCSPASTLEDIRPLVDDLVCLIAPDTERFAVANYYQDFHDMGDDEVRALLAHRPD
ncbi:MAG: phosphoribosyltransferase [Acidobacteria bacterium]|nr:phosphoribosyltransferase [Acidobacteriota bacterium]